MVHLIEQDMLVELEQAESLFLSNLVPTLHQEIIISSRIF